MLDQWSEHTLYDPCKYLNGTIRNMRLVVHKMGAISYGHIAAEGRNTSRHFQSSLYPIKHDAILFSSDHLTF